MNKGVELRLAIHNILFDIYTNNKTLDSPTIKKIINKYNNIDIAFINNVCLNSMRLHFHAKKILDIYAKKKQKMHSLILLNSAIVQIVFLEFKEYAVINCSVEIAKKLNIYHGFINSCLKEIAKNKKILRDLEIQFNELPKWFINKSSDYSIEDKKKFTKNFFKKPSMHLVFKNEDYLKNFEEKITPTSKVSGFVSSGIKIKKIQSFKKGHWWVQDYSTSFPLNNVPQNLLDKSSIDLCSAPGGKSFQILSKAKSLVLNDVSKNRIKILKENLNRLKFKVEIHNKDILDMKSNNKFDFIILDAPCSSIGTLRRNPEILFKKNEPKLQKLIILQKQLLNKCSELLNKNGSILYMVCSFFRDETSLQIEEFLSKNKDFKLEDFHLEGKNLQKNNFIVDKYMLTLPTKINDFYVDGFFAAYLKKYK